MKKLSLPIILGVTAVATLALTGSKTKSVSTLPFSVTCESILVKDPIKTDIWFTDQARSYIDTLPDLESLSYTTLVSNVLQKINKVCYDKFMSGKMNKNETLLVAILRDKAQKGFITAYFGDPSILDENDKIIYNQFTEVIHPERLEEFSKFINWTTDLDKEFNDVLKTLEQNKCWPS